MIEPMAHPNWRPSATTNWLDGTTTTSRNALCPDLLRLSDLGEADGWRGRTVRGFFRVLRWVTGL